MADKKAKKEEVVVDIKALQKERLALAGIELSVEELKVYLAKPDDLGVYVDGTEIPVGYKKCGKCSHVLKLYLFNKNKDNKLHCTGNCKACQRASASKSYAKTKKKRNYKKYYAENKEAKQEQARKYYQNNKEEINAKHKLYLATAKGKKVMKKAHAKRAEAIANNKGIPYTRAMVLDRDRRDGEFAVCYLCGEPILDTTGAACHLDHVVSIVNGGLDCFTNIAAVHQTCNLTKEKDDRNLKVETVESIVKLAEEYIDNHPELFDNEEE